MGIRSWRRGLHSLQSELKGRARTVLHLPSVVSSVSPFWQKSDLSQQSLTLEQPEEPSSMHFTGQRQRTRTRMSVHPQRQLAAAFHQA